MGAAVEVVNPEVSPCAAAMVVEPEDVGGVVVVACPRTPRTIGFRDVISQGY